MPAYKTPVTVLFRHCDVAGIVFYPRYVEMVNDVIERWFDEAGKSSFKTRIIAMHAETKVLEVRSALVWVKSGNAFKGEGTMKSEPLPDDIRAKMEQFLEVDPKDFIQIAGGES